MDLLSVDVQRSDPKEGSASDYPFGRGFQGNVIKIADSCKNSKKHQKNY